MHHINLTRRNTQWQSSLSPCIDPANDKLSQTTNSPFEFCRSFSGQNTWTYNATELCGLQVKVLTIISTSHSTSKRISGDMESVKNNLFNQRAAAQILWLSASSLLCESMTYYSVHCTHWCPAGRVVSARRIRNNLHFVKVVTIKSEVCLDVQK